MDEGYIKFNCNWRNEPIEISDRVFKSLTNLRAKLYKLSLLGMYEDGIGYGNISIRDSENTFIISGSATGGVPELKKSHYSRVDSYNFQTNIIGCTGTIRASSESLSHAAIYEVSKKINAVIHVHSRDMWDFFIDLLPTTSKTILYGTPEMALGITEIITQNQTLEKGCIIMGGHEEGILVYGASLNLAGKYLLKLYHQSLNKSAIS